MGTYLTLTDEEETMIRDVRRSLASHIGKQDPVAAMVWRDVFDNYTVAVEQTEEALSTFDQMEEYAEMAWEAGSQELADVFRNEVAQLDEVIRQKEEKLLDMATHVEELVEADGLDDRDAMFLRAVVAGKYERQMERIQEEQIREMQRKVAPQGGPQQGGPGPGPGPGPGGG